VDYLLVKSFILDSAGPYAIVFTALHHHIHHEAWMDVIFGSFEAEPSDDWITFGCRVGSVEGSDEPGAIVLLPRRMLASIGKYAILDIDFRDRG
jgi:hypothetical protein